MIIGADPGKMTGLFTLANVGGLVIVEPDQVPHEDVFQYFMGVFSRLSMEGFSGHDVQVSIERYFITQRTVKLTRQPEALKVTGIIEAITASHGYVTLQRAKSGLAKLAADSELKRSGLYTTGHRHANDAARQAYATLLDKDYQTWDRLYRGETIAQRTIKEERR